MNKAINLIAPINTLSYGYTSLNMVVELEKLGVKVCLFPIGQVNPNTQQIEQTIINDPRYNRSVMEAVKNSYEYDSAAPSVRIWHANNLAQHVGCGLRYGFPIFELDTFTDIEKHQLNSIDEVIVCSEWAKKVCQDNGITTPISVVPLGVDTEIFKPDRQNNYKRPYRFINIGKWEVRKGHDILVDAFNKAFTKDDNVELVMLTHNAFLTTEQDKEWRDLYYNSPMGKAGRINILARQQTQADLANIIKQCDCGVFPARAEGWNLDLLECMACGLPVITTNFSGHTEFCNSENSNLITINEVEPAYDGFWFHGHGNWASLGDNQIDQLVSFMRDEYEIGPRIHQNNIETAQKFTWKNSAEKLCNITYRPNKKALGE